jgi:hypothetical protein
MTPYKECVDNVEHSWTKTVMADASVREIQMCLTPRRRAPFNWSMKSVEETKKYSNRCFISRQGLCVRKSLTAIAVLLSTGKRATE